MNYLLTLKPSAPCSPLKPGSPRSPFTKCNFWLVMNHIHEQALMSKVVVLLLSRIIFHINMKINDTYPFTRYSSFSLFSLYAWFSLNSNSNIIVFFVSEGKTVFYSKYIYKN